MEGMRRPTPTVYVGRVPIGGAHPIAVQSMTNTPTRDVEATTAQVLELHRAGSEIVRLTVNDEEAAKAVPEIKRRLLAEGVEVPLVGDFHFNGHLLLRKYPKMAEALDKFRINPGTLGRGRHKDEHFAEMIRIAMDLGKPVRIGANWGSLDPALLTELMDRNASRPEPKSAHEVVLEALVESAVRAYEAALEMGLGEDKLVLSAKVSKARDLVWVYRELARRTQAPSTWASPRRGWG